MAIKVFFLLREGWEAIEEGWEDLEKQEPSHL